MSIRFERGVIVRYDTAGNILIAIEVTRFLDIRVNSSISMNCGQKLVKSNWGNCV